MDELKPCPFCGSKSVGYFDESLSIVNCFYLKGIKCDNCGGAIIVSDPYTCADDVIEKWNRMKDDG